MSGNTARLRVATYNNSGVVLLSTSSRLENLRGSRPCDFLLGTRQVEAQLRGCDVPSLVPEVLKVPAGLSESQVRGMRDRQRHYVAKICGLTSSSHCCTCLPSPKQQFASLWAGQVRWYGPACGLPVRSRSSASPSMLLRAVVLEPVTSLCCDNTDSPPSTGSGRNSG